MKKILLSLMLLGSTVSVSHAQMKCAPGKCGGGKCGMSKAAPAQKPKKRMVLFQSVPKEKAVLLQEGNAKMFCPECGMTLPMFYKTNHAAVVNGKTKQYCSLHCLVDDMRKGAKPTDIKVVDTESLKFIDAKKAYYVVGSDVRGTMTRVSKYAFAHKADAESFAKIHGGKVTDFNGALKAAQADFKKDTAMIEKKRAMMRKKGEMLYANKCEKTHKRFSTIAQAKAFILDSGLCKGLNGRQLQAVGLYLTNE
jgi:nitrous oxide reductase accessory protein NosL